MLRIEFLIGEQVYRFADQTLDYGNYFWEPRIINHIDLEREFEMVEESGNRIRNLQINLDNSDRFFNPLHDNFSLLNKKMKVYFKDGDNITQRFSGKVIEIISFGSKITLNIMESGYEYLSEPFPDAQIAYDYYSENGINDSWNAIPIVMGHIKKLPVAWVNSFRSEFMICSGPIVKVERIYFEDVVVYDEEQGIYGYQPDFISSEIKFRIFLGTGEEGSPEISGGEETVWPGFAYIKLYKVVDEVEEPADPIMPDGSVAKIYVDVVGLQKDDDETLPERNPAKLLHMFYSKPITGYQGYGLGITENDLDFEDAIQQCEVNEFFIDGVIDKRAEFSEWLHELCRCCRGIIIEEDGKIRLIVDQPDQAVMLELDDSGETGVDCIIGDWTEPSLDNQYNRFRLSYDYDMNKQRYRKVPQVNKESPLENEDNEV